MLKKRAMISQKMRLNPNLGHRTHRKGKKKSTKRGRGPQTQTILVTMTLNQRTLTESMRQ